MKAQTINRALIESGLELKCLLFFGVGITIVISVSFALYWEVTGHQIRTQNPRTANLLVVQHLIFRHWTAMNEKSEEAEKGASDDFLQFMEILNNSLRKEPYQSRFIHIPTDGAQADANQDFVTNHRTAPISAADRRIFEEHILKQFSVFKENYDSVSSPLEYYEFFEEDGKYQYFQVIRADKLCNSCHNVLFGREYEVGEMMGAVHVEIPKPPGNKDAMAKSWAMLLGVAIITAFLSLIAFDIVIRWTIIRPLRVLRGFAEGISRGEKMKRAELHTGDEFESLAESFNRMLRHLAEGQEKLRKANKEQETKVNELAHLSIQLHEMNRVKGDFMATMSHELKTPLNSILGFSSVLGSIDSLDERQKKYVSNINNSGKTLLDMINDILDMTKMESGRMEVQLSQFYIGKIVEAQCDMAKPLLDKKNLELQLSIENELPLLSQDESRIQQILNNLLSNAIKFTPEGGLIKVSVRKLENILEIQVSDNGIGISEMDQQVIFEKFRQGARKSGNNETLVREHSGSGLGLSIVKEICRMLEGEISVESQIGFGSIFTVRVPWTLAFHECTESEMMQELHHFSNNRTIKLPPESNWQK